MGLVAVRVVVVVVVMVVVLMVVVLVAAVVRGVVRVWGLIRYPAVRGGGLAPMPTVGAEHANSVRDHVVQLVWGR